MKVKNVLVVLLVVALAGVAVFYSIANHNAKQALAKAEAQIAADQKAITAAQGVIDQAQAAIKELQAQAAADKEQLQSDVFTANLHAEQLRQQLNRIQSETPNELGATAVSLLGNGAQIRYNGTDFIVGVETFRLITTRLADQSDFTLVREPAYKKTILDWAALSSNQDGQLAQKDTIISAKDRQIAALNDTVAQLHKEIKTYKSIGFWGKVKWTAIGAAAGAVAGHFVK